MFVQRRLTLELAHISHCAIGASVAAAALYVDSEILPSIIGGWQGVGSERRGNTCLLVLTAEDSGDVKEHRLGKSRQKTPTADTLKLAKAQNHVTFLQPDLVAKFGN